MDSGKQLFKKKWFKEFEKGTDTTFYMTHRLFIQIFKAFQSKL